MYDLMLYPLPLIMVIASAGRNIAVSYLKENKACYHCMTTYFLLVFIISTSGSFTCHDLPVSVAIRFCSRESLFLDKITQAAPVLLQSQSCLQETIII